MEESLDKKVLCVVYASRKRQEMYLYVTRDQGLGAVPEALMSVFGEPRHVMDLVLHAGRTLARVDVSQVMATLAEQGFFLQMPPGEPGESANA